MSTTRNLLAASRTAASPSPSRATTSGASPSAWLRIASPPPAAQSASSTLVRGLGVAAAGAHELRAALGERNRAGAVVSSRSRATAAEEAIAARPRARQAERPHWPPSSRRCRHAHRLPLGRLSDGPAAGAASC